MTKKAVKIGTFLGTLCALVGSLAIYRSNIFSVGHSGNLIDPTPTPPRSITDTATFDETVDFIIKELCEGYTIVLTQEARAALRAEARLPLTLPDSNKMEFVTYIARRENRGLIIDFIDPGSIHVSYRLWFDFPNKKVKQQWVHQKRSVFLKTDERNRDSWSELDSSVTDYRLRTQEFVNVVRAANAGFDVKDEIIHVGPFLYERRQRDRAERVSGAFIHLLTLMGIDK